MKKELGHKFLKKLGKTRLRPGGLRGTNFLLAHTNFKEGDLVLEVACNRGVNLLQLAKKYPKTAFIGIDVDKVSIAEACEESEKQNLKNIKFLKADAFHLEFPDNSFDYIINEAMLTMFSDKSKEKALREYYRVLKNGGLLLTHDISLVNNYEETKKDLSSAININVFPLPKKEWVDLFSKIGFKTVNSLQGELTLMTLKGMLSDEGVLNTLKIVKNGLKSENRKQFVKMRLTFNKLKTDMNFVCFVNKKPLQ
ncbi:class I SAM-dependent methyltransferase [Gemella cuniculi]|uniref:class I SAM-dependent methyltransferase n=1 Tax=Gemella cuniculi TaxID=150240 RepID=UPI00040A256B|nr:class I SAM-dependent methyltransferase [Gemella cuniculi]